MDHYRVSVSPHVRHEDSTRSIMTDVCVALTPSLLWGIYLFGMRAFSITVISVLSCLFFEALSQKLMRRPVTISDGSATVSALLLAMNLPVAVPLWVVPLGAFFAIVITKQLFGGLGKNFVNPVLAARAFLFISFPAYMTSFTRPGVYFSPFRPKLDASAVADAVSSATPLRSLKEGVLPEASLREILVGEYAGSIGELSSLLLLLGFVYLLLRRVISWHIPVSFLSTVALLSFLFPKAAPAWEFTVYSLCSGGLLLGAIFMATDYVTSPVTRGGKLVYGVLCGALTVLIRYFGGYSEGVSFAILMANLLVWYLDRWFRPAPYGTRRALWRRKPKEETK